VNSKKLLPALVQKQVAFAMLLVAVHSGGTRLLIGLDTRTIDSSVLASAATTSGTNAT